MISEVLLIIPLLIGVSLGLLSCAPRETESAVKATPAPLQWLDSLIAEDSARGCRLVRIISDETKTDSLPLTPQASWQEEFQLIRKVAEKALGHKDNRYTATGDSLSGREEVWTNEGTGGAASQVWSKARFVRNRDRTLLEARNYTRDLLFESEERCLCEQREEALSGLRCTLEISKKALWPARPLFVRIVMISSCL